MQENSLGDEPRSSAPFQSSRLENDGGTYELKNVV